MKKSKYYLLAALVACATGAQANSLDDIYQLALENDPQLKADTAAYQAGQENRNLGRANLLPQINGSASYTLSESDTAYSISEGLPANGAKVNTGSDVVEWGISLEQALFDLGAWHTYKRGIALSEQTEAEYSADQQSLIVRVAEAYFNVLRAVDNLEATLAEEKALEQQLEQTRQRFEVGLTPITDVHDAQAAYDSASAATLQARGQLGISYEALEVLTGQTHDAIAPLSDDFPVVQPTPTDRHSWVEFALENNFTLKAASYSAEAARANARTARANHLPTVSASASYRESYNENDRESLLMEDWDREGYSVGVQLRVPLFTGGRVSSQRRQAYAQSMQAEELFNAQQRNVIQNTRSLHLAVETGVAQVKARAQAIVSNESAVRATQSGFEVGTRNLVEVLLAQRALYQARRDYSNALYDYIIQTIRLREAAGMLTPADIERIDQYLRESEMVRRSDFGL